MTHAAVHAIWNSTENDKNCKYCHVLHDSPWPLFLKLIFVGSLGILCQKSLCNHALSGVYVIFIIIFVIFYFLLILQFRLNELRISQKGFRKFFFSLSLKIYKGNLRALSGPWATHNEGYKGWRFWSLGISLLSKSTRRHVITSKRFRYCHGNHTKMSIFSAWQESSPLHEQAAESSNGHVQPEWQKSPWKELRC